jgi:hypothetical protein
MHFVQPVHVAASTSSPSRRISIAIGGQRGMHSPHSSQSCLSTTAIVGGRRRM